MESAIYWIMNYGGIFFWAYLEAGIFFRFGRNILGVQPEREKWFMPCKIGTILFMLCVPVRGHGLQLFVFSLAALWLFRGSTAQKICTAFHGAFIIYYFAYFRAALGSVLQMGGYADIMLYYIGVLLGNAAGVLIEMMIGEACGEVEEESDVWTYAGVSAIGYVLLAVLRSMVDGGEDGYTIFVTFLFISLFVIIDFALYIHYQREAYVKKQVKRIGEFQKKSELEQDHFKRLEEVYGEFRGLAHDMDRYLSVLSAMKGNESAEAEKTELTEEIRSRIGEVNREMYCMRPVLNSLLNEKKKRAEADGVKMELFVEPGFDFPELDDYAVIGIVSNLIDNAIDAAAKREQDRFVLVRMFAVNDGKQKFMRIENSQLPRKEENTGTFFTTNADRMKHGYGLKNVQKLVEEKQGKLRLKSEGEHFLAEVVF